MIIIRYAQEELIVTDREPALWKRAHPRFIIGFKSIRSGSANVFPVLEITLVDVVDCQGKLTHFYTEF